MTEIEFIKACYDHRRWNITVLMTARQRIKNGENAQAVYTAILATME